MPRDVTSPLLFAPQLANSHFNYQILRVHPANQNIGGEQLSMFRPGFDQRVEERPLFEAQDRDMVIGKLGGWKGRLSSM